jgi:hypothetical protein
MITKEVDGQISLPLQGEDEGFAYLTGRQVDVTGQTELRKDIPILDENDDPTGEFRNVHDGWVFFPDTVDEFAGGFAIEDYDRGTPVEVITPNPDPEGEDIVTIVWEDGHAIVWMDASPADVTALEEEGQNSSDLRLFVSGTDEGSEDETIPGQQVSAYAQWVIDNIPPGPERGKLVSAYAQGVNRGQAKKAWLDYYREKRESE